MTCIDKNDPRWKYNVIDDDNPEKIMIFSIYNYPIKIGKTPKLLLISSLLTVPTRSVLYLYFLSSTSSTL